MASAAALALLLAAGAAAEQRYTDPAGDAGGAPDLTGIVVTNDAAGEIGFRITSNQATLAADAGMFIGIDSDGNAGTGEGGLDYLFVLDGSDQSYDLGRWNGSAYDFAVPSETVSASYEGGALVVRVDRSDLGGTRAFRFVVVGAQYSGDEIVTVDEAPNDGVFAYVLAATAPPLVLRAGMPTAVPARPAAGKAFAVRVPITRADTGRRVTSGRVTCAVTVGGVRVRAVGGFANGLARCALRVPANTKGKGLRGTLTVAFGGKTVARSFAYRVA